MKRLLFIFALLSVRAFAQQVYYVDPPFTGGGNNGSAANPWTSISSGWSTINITLATQNVTVYFSATQSQTAQFDYSSRTDTSTHVLTLNGTEKVNANDGINNNVTNWVAGVALTPCIGFECAKNGAWIGHQYTVNYAGAGGAITSSNSVNNCQGYLDVRGFHLKGQGKIALLTYVHDLTVEYNEEEATSGAAIGPGNYFGPGQQGPCNASTSNVGGPDNVVFQLNYTHKTFGECIYDGAETSDPPGFGSGEYTSNGMTCTSNCNTGAHHRILNNTNEDCGFWGGQGDGTDIKDGHPDLWFIGNTNIPSLDSPAGAGGAMGVVAESGAIFSGNYFADPGNVMCNGIRLADSWYNFSGRQDLPIIANNVVNGFKSGACNNYGIYLTPPDLSGSLAVWTTPIRVLNNTIFSIASPCIAVATSSLDSGVGATAENNICSGTTGGISGGTTQDYNQYFNAGVTCPVSGEAHSQCGDPKFISTIAPFNASNFKVQASSPALLTGNVFSSLFTTDYFGSTRTVPWSRGFFQTPPPAATFCGVSGDTSVHIPPNYDTFMPPALGGTYVDPTFGCTIKRLSDVVHNPGSQTVPDPNTAQCKHFYALVVPDDVNHTIVHAVCENLPSFIAGPVPTYASSGTFLVKQSAFPTANLTSQGFVIWDIVDPLTFYYTATNQFIMGKITGLPGCAATSACTVTSTVLATFSSYTAVSLMDDEDISEDGLHYYLGARSGSGINDAGCANSGQLCDILFISINATGGNATSATLLGTPFTGSWWHKIQAALANRINIENLNGGGADVEYNTDGSVYATLSAAHHDFIHNPTNNNEIIASPWAPGTAANKCPHLNGMNAVDTASATSLGCLLEAFMPLNGNYGVPPPKSPASHFSTRNNSLGWVLYEAESYLPNTCPDAANPYCEHGVGSVTDMSKWGLYDGELDLIKADGSQFLRLAHHRSRSGAGYWAGSRGVITRDAQWGYFDSNMNSCPITGGCGSQTTTLDSQYTDMYAVQLQNQTTPLPMVNLPLTWVNNLEYLPLPSTRDVFPNTWLCGATVFPTGGGNYATTQTGVQQVVNDAETCRKNNNIGVTIVLPVGITYTGANGIILPQTAGDTSTAFIVITSSVPSPSGQTVCSLGIQDNLASSTQPGIRSLGCNGQNVSYQLGTTVTTLSPGPFTLANGVSTATMLFNGLSNMYTVECTSSNCNAISTATADVNNVGPHHYAILNAELRPQAGLTTPGSPVAIGQGNETLTSQIPTHIHLGYSYIHGDWGDAPVSGGVATGAPTGANSLPHGIALSGCIYCSIAYNYMDRALRPGSEGHGISQSLAQQVKIVHNWIEGQSIGMICGGFGSAITINNFVTCQDEEDRGNRYTYPYSWLLAWQAGFKPNGGSLGFVRKNAHEYKFSERVLLDGNIFENVDDSGAQNGTIISFKTAQTSAGGLGTNYWTTQDNTTITNNIGRNSCNGPSVGDRSDAGGSNGGGVSLPAQFYLIQNNLFYNESVVAPGCNAGGNNAAPQYGWRIGSSVPGNVWSATVVRDASGATTTATLTPAPGLGVSDINVGDPLTMTNCSDPTFNVGNQVQGPLALTGTLVNGLTVVYANAGTANAGSGVTGCVLSSAQGWPNGIIFNHNTVIDDPISNNNPSNSANGGTNIFPLARNFSVTNSVLINGGLNSTSGEGTRTSVRMFDPTTEVFNNTLLPGRDSAVSCPGHAAGAGGMAVCYTEYTASHAAITPVTLYGVPTAFCTGNDPTTGVCAGVFAAMSQSSFPIVINDWTQYRLCHTGDAGCNNLASLYSAGHVSSATDGTDLGFNPTPIQAAQTSILYTCGSACGTGPFIDALRPPPTAPCVACFMAKSTPEVLQ